MKYLNRNGLFNKNLNFYSKSMIFAVLSIAAAAANYLLYPAIARTLSITEFKDFSILLASITQIGSLFIALNVISIFLVSKKGEKEAKAPLASIQKSLIVFMLAIFIVYGIVSPFLNSVFGLKDGYLTILLLFTLLLSIPSSVWSGFFQGNGELVRVGLFGLILASFKLILAVLLAIKFGVSGAIIGIFFASVISLIIFWLLPGDKPPVSSTFILKRYDFSTIKQYKGIIIGSLVSVLVLSILQVLDLLSVTALVPDNIAGNYAGISSLSRIIFYVGFILIWILLPEIAKANRTHRANLIKKSYLLYIGIGLIALISAALGMHRLVPLILGPDFNIGQSLLITVLLFQITITILTFQSFVLLVFNKLSVALFLVFNLCISLVACMVIGANIVHLLLSLATVNAVSIIIFGVLIHNYGIEQK